MLTADSFYPGIIGYSTFCVYMYTDSSSIFSTMHAAMFSVTVWQKDAKESVWDRGSMGETEKQSPRLTQVRKRIETLSHRSYRFISGSRTLPTMFIRYSIIQNSHTANNRDCIRSASAVRAIYFIPAAHLYTRVYWCSEFNRLSIFFAESFFYWFFPSIYNDMQIFILCRNADSLLS